MSRKNLIFIKISISHIKHHLDKLIDVDINSINSGIYLYMGREYE